MRVFGDSVCGGVGDGGRLCLCSRSGEYVGCRDGDCSGSSSGSRAVVTWDGSGGNSWGKRGLESDGSSACPCVCSGMYVEMVVWRCGGSGTGCVRCSREYTFFFYFLQLYCLNGISPMGKSGCFFPGKASSRQIRATQPTARAGYFSASIIHQNSDIDYRNFNVRTDVNACDCTWGCTDTRKGFCTES